MSLGVPRERIVVLPNPVVLPAVLPKRLGRSHVRLVYLGLFARAKGVFDLIDALTRLPPECLGRTRLVLAGNGELAASARARRASRTGALRRSSRLARSGGARPAAGLGRRVRAAFVCGRVADVAARSRWRGACRSISTTVGSIPEHVRDGVQGLLVQPGDVSELAGAIERIVMDDALRTRMGELARARRGAAEHRAVRAEGRRDLRLGRPQRHDPDRG